MTEPAGQEELSQAQAKAALEQGLEEMLALRTSLRTGITEACDTRAKADGHPVHPDLLAGLLLDEASGIAIGWFAAQGRRPEEAEEYYEHLLRRARRGFRAQLQQVFRGSPESQNRIVTP